jgi:hypothetical protein
MTKRELADLVLRAYSFEYLKLLHNSSEGDMYELRFYVRSEPSPERELKFEPSGTE